MASIILPTTQWTSACEDVVTQLTPTDELFIVCDSEEDPVTEYRDRSQVTVVVAGEPSNCSGKANAVAAGLEAANDEMIICTDADFEHESSWLAQVKTGIDTYGAVSTLPFFQVRSPIGYFLDAPILMFGASIFLTGEAMWGGTIGFHREQVEMQAMIRDLRQTVTDDLLIGEYVEGHYMDLSLTASVPVEGSMASLLNRSVRFMRSTLYFSPRDVVVVFSFYMVLLLASVVMPLLTVAGVTIAAGLVYRQLGFRRWTFLLAYPGFLVSIGTALYGLSRTEFSWHGRRYRWTSKFDVTVIDR